MQAVSKDVILKLDGISKHFGSLRAVDKISIDIYDGEFFTIVGPSGSGKTTLIRMLVGMDQPTAGDIVMLGDRINEVPANKRPTCMVFQSLALFPHKSVGENIEFSLKMKGVDAETRRKKCYDLLDLLHIGKDFYNKAVTQCSGGERQRIALARALAFDPKILFFDEPLSAIDYRLRKTLEKELRDIHRETGKTFVYITHSLEEAMVMSDRIGIMRGGRLVQVGTPDEIYNNPVNKFVSEFMGDVNVIEFSKSSNGQVFSSTFNASFAVTNNKSSTNKGFLVVRPEALRFLSNVQDAENHLEGVLYNEYSLGSRFQYQVRVGDNVFTIEKLRENRFSGKLDDKVLIGWDIKDSIVVEEN